MPKIIGYHRDGRRIFEIAGGADNIAVTAGSGTNVATDERTIAATTVQLQRVLATGGSSVAADDVSVTTTSGEIVAARETRHSLTILASPTNTDDIYIGASGVNAATPASGFRMVAGSAISLDTTAAIHGDAVSGTQTIYYIETYS